MIKLYRIRTASAIPDIFRGTKRVELNKKLLLAQKTFLADKTKHTWDSGIWGKSKRQLLAETNNKCAYCEAPTAVVAYGDVEHYRPKSIYWWLAYSYENYLASCTLCNQAFKKDKFPFAGSPWKGPLLNATAPDTAITTLAAMLNPDPLNEHEGMPYADLFNEHSREGALLINPYYDEPETIFEYRSDDKLKEVEIAVVKTVTYADKIQKAIVENYGLNRLELRQLRFEWYDLYLTHKLVLKEPKVSQALKKRAEEKIAQLQDPSAPFSGMIKYFESVP